MRQSSNEVISLNKNIQRVFHQALQGNAELAALQNSHWDNTLHLALQLQNSLETMRGVEVVALLGEVGQIQHAFNLIAREMHDVRAVVAEVMTSASRLQDSVEDTSSKLAQMASLGGIADVVFKWGGLSAIVFVLYHVAPSASARVAGAIAAAFLSVYLVLANSLRRI